MRSPDSDLHRRIQSLCPDIQMQYNGTKPSAAVVVNYFTETLCPFHEYCSTSFDILPLAVILLPMSMVVSCSIPSQSPTVVDTIFESSVTFAENLFKQIPGVLPKTSDPSSYTVKRTFTRDLCDCEKFDSINATLRLVTTYKKS